MGTKESQKSPDNSQDTDRCQELFRFPAYSLDRFIRVLYDPTHDRAMVVYPDPDPPHALMAAMYPNTAAGGIEALVFAEETAARLRAGRGRRFDPHAADLYIIECQETRRCKVGVSHHPHQRLLALQVSSPTLLRLVACYRGAGSAEQEVHTSLAPRRPIRIKARGRVSGRPRNGEWFRGPASDIVAQVESVLRECAIEILPR